MGFLGFIPADMIGAVAGVFTTICFVPQVVKVLRLRETRDLSLLMLAMMAAGASLWLIYGWMLGSWPMMAANGASLAMVSTLLVLKVRYG